MSSESLDVAVEALRNKFEKGQKNFCKKGYTVFWFHDPKKLANQIFFQWLIDTKYDGYCVWAGMVYLMTLDSFSRADNDRLDVFFFSKGTSLTMVKEKVATYVTLVKVGKEKCS
jgi:hypothetical protein